MARCDFRVEVLQFVVIVQRALCKFEVMMTCVEQLHVCEEGSLEGYSPNHEEEDGEALVSTLQRKWARRRLVDCVA
jgi:hypothetical protein